MKTPISFDGPKDGHIFIYGMEGLKFCKHNYIGVMYEVQEPLFYQRLGSLLLHGSGQGHWRVIYSTHLKKLQVYYNTTTTNFLCDIGIFATLGRMCEEENNTKLPIIGNYYVYDKIEDFLMENFELAL